MRDRLGRQSNQLIATLAKSEIAEPSLHLRPLVAFGVTELVRIVVERLVQHRQEHERRAVAARRGFRERLQEVDIAAARLERCVFQRLPGFVHDQQQAVSSQVGDGARGVFEAVHDRRGGALRGRGR